MNMDLDAATKEAPTLTLDPFAEAKAEIVEKKPEELVEEQAVPEMELTPEEQKQVDDFAAQIDLTNTQAVLQYGAGSQLGCLVGCDAGVDDLFDISVHDLV